MSRLFCAIGGLSFLVKGECLDLDTHNGIGREIQLANLQIDMKGPRFRCSGAGQVQRKGVGIVSWAGCPRVDFLDSDSNERNE